MTNTDLIKNQGYNIKEVYGEAYYQLLKVFFVKSSKYHSMTLQAKVAYSLLKDRFNYSVKNHWLDKDGNIYFIFTNKELMEVMDIGSTATITKVKKELEDYQLLAQKRQGKNKPNMLYLLRPDVTAKDVYALEPHGSSINELPGQPSQSLEPQGSLENELPKKRPQTLATSGSLESEHNQYKEVLDTPKIHTDTDKWDFSSNNYSKSEVAKQNYDLVHHSKDVMSAKATPNFLSSDAWARISSYCKTPSQVHEFVSVILNAKNSVLNAAKEQNCDVVLLLENESAKSAIDQAILSYFSKIRQAETTRKPITNQKGYLYRTFTNLFTELANEEAMSQSKEELNNENID